MNKVKITIIALTCIGIAAFSYKPAPAKRIEKPVLLGDIFPNYPNLKNLDSMLGVKLVKVPKFVKNPIKPNETDSLFDCYYQKSVFGVGRIMGDDVFYKAIILDPQIVLYNGIGVGMKKSDFNKKTKYNLESNCDTLILTCGCTADASVKYVFNKSRLKSITYNYPLE